MLHCIRGITILCVICASSLSCLNLGESYPAIAPGTWRATLELVGGELNSKDPGMVGEEESGAILPFLFEVVYDTRDSFHIILRNASERIVVRDIKWGHDRATGHDTLRIDFPVLDSHISAEYEEDYIEGRWYQHYRGDDYSIPFRAKQGETERFVMLTERPVPDFSGTWEATFSIEKDSADRNTLIGKFSQHDDSLSGTFLSKTGDYRFLEGKASGDRMFLSTFDGGHAYLFEAKMLADGTLSGIYRSGNHYKTYWSARRSGDVSLPDADSLTIYAGDGKPVDFSLPTPDGDIVSPGLAEFSGKPFLIQIMGTWCVNCLDETRFLKEYMEENPEQELKIIAIAFERYRDSTRAMRALATYKKELDIPYPIALGGYFSKEEASSTLSFLDQVVAYPTLIFVDKEGTIRKIHTGFSGPATEGYEEFKQEFHQAITDLLTE